MELLENAALVASWIFDALHYCEFSTDLDSDKLDRSGLLSNVAALLLRYPMSFDTPVSCWRYTATLSLTADILLVAGAFVSDVEVRHEWLTCKPIWCSVLQCMRSLSVHSAQSLLVGVIRRWHSLLLSMIHTVVLL